jgi:hypothetical protein
MLGCFWFEPRIRIVCIIPYVLKQPELASKYLTDFLKYVTFSCYKKSSRVFSY